MTEKIALLVDSGSDVPPAVLAAHENVAVVPLNVHLNGRDYQDNVDLTPDEFYAGLKQAQTLPKTASPAPAAVSQKLHELFAAGYSHVLGLTLASALSATYTGFALAAEEFEPAKVAMLDTKSVGIGSGLQAVYALQLIAQGVDFASLKARVAESIAHSRIFFYVPTLHYLRAGGRIGKVAGLVGTALKIKPVISCDPDGVYYPVTKSRSEPKAIAKMIALALAAAKPHAQIAVAQGADPELLAKTVAAIQAQGHPVDFTGNVSPALGVHTGPGLIGIAVQNP
ncbi:DegV family protein [Lacticaseibacillus baoqingensis]|uniref:DegV family protein n=1 Tax=Lacticaseibacillus baoqingensis TaxID=2486013 RepID=A0ABW4E4P7_9LACO